MSLDVRILDDLSTKAVPRRLVTEADGSLREETDEEFRGRIRAKFREAKPDVGYSMKACRPGCRHCARERRERRTLSLALGISVLLAAVAFLLRG